LRSILTQYAEPQTPVIPHQNIYFHAVLNVILQVFEAVECIAFVSYASQEKVIVVQVYALIEICVPSVALTEISVAEAPHPIGDEVQLAAEVPELSIQVINTRHPAGRV
jgi:hypothetical protein